MKTLGAEFKILSRKAFCYLGLCYFIHKELVPSSFSMYINSMDESYSFSKSFLCTITFGTDGFIRK